MLNILVIAILGFLCAALMVRLLESWALHHDFLSIPTKRSSHDSPTPLGGGVAIALVSLGITGLMMLLGGVRWSFPVAVYLVVGGVIAGMGFLDDRRNLSARVRLVGQVACALVVVSTGAFLPVVEVPVLGMISLGTVLGVLLAVVWLVWMTNAFNFIDGIDAMSGTQAVVAASGWVMVFLNREDSLLLVAGLLAVTSIGFLFYNLTPSLIFMGDTGSTFLGFSFAALPLIFSLTQHDPRLLVVGALFVTPALFDASVTLVRRLLSHHSPFEGHRTHFYQRMTRLGYSHIKVSGTYGAISLFSVGCGLFYLAQGASWLGTIAALAPIGAMSILAISITAAERRSRWQPLLDQLNQGRGAERNVDSSSGR